MAISGIVIFAIILSFILICYHNFYYKRRKLPPGPTPLPLLGNLISFVKNPPGEQCFIQWSKIFGPVFTFWMSDVPMVIVTDYNVIIDTFLRNGDAYVGRYQNMDILIKGTSTGVIHTEGDLWRDQRRFALRVLRDFGLGKNLMQDKILSEVLVHFNTLNQKLHETEEIQITKTIDIIIASIINNIVVGYRFEGETLEEFHRLRGIMDEFVSAASHPLFNLLAVYPNLLRYAPYLKQKLAKVRVTYGAISNFFKEQITKHQTEIDFNNADTGCTDFVEAFLREKAKIDQLASMCLEIWSAGQETTTNTIAWGIAYIIHNPDVQEKLQKEFDEVIGSTERLITMTNRPDLPYACAVINEIQRATNLITLNVQHKTTRDVNINGFFIPKDTIIIPQISSVLYDEKLFPEPRRFDPNRFLTNDGKLKRIDELIPFSVGKRQCLGESLARMELFLIIANIYNQYKIKNGKEMPSLERKAGGLVVCPEFTCKIEKR